MDLNTYKEIENYMLSMICDTVHDAEHIYRVLHLALDIASHEPVGAVDLDVLITACILHDIGRVKQLAGLTGNHADAGGDMAYEWLKRNGFSEEFAGHVRDCVKAHSFRGNIDNGATERTLEARILYDADKLDAMGATGIARTLAYGGFYGEPLYVKDREGRFSDNEGPSFIHEYRIKLSKIFDGLNTKRSKEIGETRKKAASDFVNTLVCELEQTKKGENLLLKIFP